MTEEKAEISVEEAKKIVEAEKAERVIRCAQELADILKKYNCDLNYNLSVVAKEI